MNSGDFIGRLVLQMVVVGIVAGAVIVGGGIWLWTHVGIVWPWFWK